MHRVVRLLYHLRCVRIFHLPFHSTFPVSVFLGSSSIVRGRRERSFGLVSSSHVLFRPTTRVGWESSCHRSTKLSRRVHRNRMGEDGGQIRPLSYLDPDWVGTSLGEQPDRRKWNGKGRGETKRNDPMPQRISRMACPKGLPTGRKRPSPAEDGGFRTVFFRPSPLRHFPSNPPHPRCPRRIPSLPF